MWHSSAARSQTLGQRLRHLARLTVVLAKRRVPGGLRWVLGLVFIGGGIVGFLPILGFWMIPVGLVLIGLDVPPIRRWLERQTSRLRHRRD